MGYQPIFQNWIERIVGAISGHRFAGSGAGNPGFGLLGAVPRPRSPRLQTVDPIMDRALQLEADERLQRKFQAIREEERNILKDLIMFD